MKLTLEVKNNILMVYDKNYFNDPQLKGMVYNERLDDFDGKEFVKKIKQAEYLEKIKKTMNNED